MSKFTVKTTVNNIIYDPKDDSFSYNEEFVSMKWTESKEREKYTQSGTGPGEFGPDPDYSDRKRYHLTHGEPPLVTTDRNPRRSPYPAHLIEEYDVNEHIKRTRPTPLTKEEIELRHAELKRKQEDD